MQQILKQISMNLFQVNRQTRENVLKVIEELSTHQLNEIPEGFTNNIIWHIGHLLATQQLLTYGLSGNDILLSDNIISEFRKGTKPESLYTAEDIEELKSLLIVVIENTEEDFEMKELTSDDFKAYPTSYGVTLQNVEDAVAFNNVHEGVHLGIIMSMKKMVFKNKS
ncbi:MAG: putative damage-inducible protein DinB [Salibacteraceae bacterium]|jgi:hypothetical protein